jgi:putative membrane protein
MTLSLRSIPLALVACLASGFAFAQTAAAPAINDAQIAQIVVTANSIDIGNGKIALKQSKTASVEEFANLMIKDHTAVNNNAVALVTRLGVVPADSDTNKSLKSASVTEQAKLQGLKGAQFDRAYLQNEVAYHQQVLDALNTVLIPNAQNAELKKTLVDVVPAFKAHLDHAEHALAALDSGKS